MLLDPVFLLDLFIAGALIILGVLSLTKNSRILQNRVFFAFVFASSCWIMSNYFSNDYKLTYQEALIANRLTLLFPGLAMAAFVIFVFVLSRPRLLHKYDKFFYAINAASLILTLTPLVATSLQKQNDLYAINFGQLALVYFAVMFCDLLVATVLLAGSIRKSRGFEKLRLQTIAWTGITVLVVNFITNAVLPLLNGNFELTNLGPLSTIVMVGGLFYSIARYKLFDIRFFVLRAFAYLSTLLVIALIFIAPFVFLILKILGRTLDVGEFVLVSLLSVAFLYLLQFLKHFFDRLTAKIFFRHYYDLQDVLDRLSDILVRTADLQLLREQTAMVLQEALKPTFLRYMLFTDKSKEDIGLSKRLDTYTIQHGVAVVDTDELSPDEDVLSALLRKRNVALSIKLQTTHEDLGFMVVGFKQSGELYRQRDLRLLSVAADEIAISLQNVLRFEQIERFNITLQEEIDAATRKLQRQNKRLEELDNIKDDFISMASHQLRTPLTSVKGYLSMVLEGDAGKLNPTQAKMLKQSFASAQRMVFLITDLLNVSRLKTGKFVIDASPVDLSGIIAEEVEQLKETAQVKNLELTYKKPASFPQLMIDEVKIRQVVMNFIDNAIYYTPEGGHIRVELDDKPVTVEFRVIDDGIGVPKSEQHHLFTKFYRATNARKARPDGTGLGLFMAEKVIVAQGGSILFNSKEGKGSTFGFTLSKSRLGVTKDPLKAKPQSSPKKLGV